MSAAIFANPVLWIILAVMAAAVVIATLMMTGNKKRRARLAASFGTPVKPPEDRIDVSGYWQLWKKEVPHHVDDITWNDLDMDKVLDKLNACQTSVGEEYLYALLHEPSFDMEALHMREALLDWLAAHPEQRLDLQVLLSKMGKMPGNALYAYCYDISAKRIRHPWLYRVLALLPLAALALLFANGAAGGLLLAASVVTNGVIYYRFKRRMEVELASLRCFSALLWGARQIGKTPLKDAHAVGRAIADSFARFKSLGGRLSGLMTERMSDADAFAEYFRILSLSNIRGFNRIIGTLERHPAEFRQLYRGVGELDAMIAVLSYRKSLPLWSRPEFITENRIETEDICHPLLDKPVPNTAALNAASLVSGSNASGKSTFIKAVAINGILAQTVHTCTAAAFRTRPALVMTSMAVRDDITASESYFMTEIKSLRRIIDKLREVNCVCYIDEILKGTNTVERIAASAAVLQYLRGQDGLFAVATHDIELTRLLAGVYDNYHFRETMTPEGIRFDYLIKPGPSQTRNAIRLLEHLGFDTRIIRDANELVERYENTRSWDEPGG